MAKRLYKADFEKFAQIVKQEREHHAIACHHSCSKDATEHIARKLATQLRAYNPDFNPVKFLAACGVD